VVSNNGALEVVAYLTEDDAKRVNVGSKVMIDNSISGVGNSYCFSHRPAD